MTRSRLAQGGLPAFATSIALLLAAACELTRFDPPLTSTIDGITLDALKKIQRDVRLTDDEKRAEIRAATGAPDTPEGDRLVNFLLTLTIP